MAGLFTLANDILSLEYEDIVNFRNYSANRQWG